jgi:predicted nucleic acid-binding protein
VFKRFPQVTRVGIESFLGEIAYTAELWRQVPSVMQYVRDPADTPYLDLAIAAGADFIVTRDSDLLSLATDRSAEGKRLRQLTRNRLRILTPREFLSEFSGPDTGS